MMMTIMMMMTINNDDDKWMNSWAYELTKKLFTLSDRQFFNM